MAGGHVTAPPAEDVYSTVVAPEGVRCIIFIAEHNGMKVWGGDVGNAYLNGTTREKVYAILGVEHGPELEGRVAIVVKSFYGLKPSCARWCEHLADTLRAMNWFKSKAVNDVWMRDTGSGFEYLAVYSDDIIVASNSPEAVYDEIKRTYTMKKEWEYRNIIWARSTVGQKGHTPPMGLLQLYQLKPTSRT